MEDMTGWCASPRGCGPRTEDVVVQAPPVVDATTVDPVTVNPVEPVPSETIHIPSNGIAPEIQDIADTTIDNAIDSLLAGLVTHGIKFVLAVVLIIAAAMAFKHFAKLSAVRAKEFADHQRREAIHKAREHEKVKAALETQEKLDRARRKRIAESKHLPDIKPNTVIPQFVEQSTVNIASVFPGIDSLATRTVDVGSAFAEYPRDLSLFSEYSNGSTAETANNDTINAPEKRFDNPFSQYL